MALQLYTLQAKINVRSLSFALMQKNGAFAMRWSVSPAAARVWVERCVNVTDSLMAHPNGWVAGVRSAPARPAEGVDGRYREYICCSSHTETDMKLNSTGSRLGFFFFFFLQK